LRIRIEEQLVRVEAMPFVGRVWAVDAIAVQEAGTCERQVAMPDLVGMLAQRDHRRCGAPVALEDDELDALGMLGEERKVDPFTVPRRTEGVGAARPDRRSAGRHATLRAAVVPERSLSRGESRVTSTMPRGDT